jgi:predicted O-linked N-acetylglucosamine transferase (SPINDLY family)
MSHSSFPVDEILRRAKVHAKDGEVDQARQLYQEILAKFPEHKVAIEGLDTLPQQQPQGTVPGQDQLDVLIGLYNQGLLQQALTQGLALARQFPGVALIPNILGAVYSGLGQKKEAVTSLYRALELDPDSSMIYNNLGGVLSDLGRYEEAAENYRSSLALRPTNYQVHHKLGLVLSRLGNYEVAIASYQSALALKSDDAEVYFNLGSALYNLGRVNEAIASYQKALQLNPGDAKSHTNLGLALNSIGQHEAAIASYVRSLKINPDSSVAHFNLANALYSLGRDEEAGRSYKHAYRLDKHNISAYVSWLHQLRLVCDWDQISDALEDDLRSLEFGKSDKEVVAPFGLLALIDDARLHRRASEAYASSKYKTNTMLGPCLQRPASGRLRIGYFSADFHNHATMFLMAELFERHNSSQFEIHAFSFGPDKKDEMRARLLDSVFAFHDVRLNSDAEIAALARSLGIDIAVDLKGYTTDSRPGIFSYRAAPLQVNYLGYPGTVGAPYIDYIVADSTLIPPAYQVFYSEKIVYLPGSYQVNDGSREISDKVMSRAEAGLPEDSFVFCCFNNTYKIAPEVFDIWMCLLKNVRGSVLWLLQANSSVEQNLGKEAVKRGVDPGRLIFANRLPLPEHLARQRLADLFLDTFNYNAHTTASDALWAGLPVLTKLGEGFASRVAGSLLNAVDLPELITSSAQEYADVALMLAEDPQKLNMLKVRLGDNLKKSTLFDSAIFTRHLEMAYVQMYRRVKEGLEPDHIYVADD